jgi:hypothetical protein
VVEGETGCHFSVENFTQMPFWFVKARSDSPHHGGAKNAFVTDIKRVFAPRSSSAIRKEALANQSLIYIPILRVLF